MPNYNRVRVSLSLVCLALILASCASQREIAIEQRTKLVNELCKFGIPRPTTMVAHIDNRYGRIEGDVYQTQSIGGKLWASVLATTESPVATSLQDSTCMAQTIQCNGWGQCWPVLVPVRCTTRNTESLGDVFGLGRVPIDDDRTRQEAMREAEYLAMDNCEIQAENFENSIRGEIWDDDDLDCVILSKQYCQN